MLRSLASSLSNGKSSRAKVSAKPCTPRPSGLCLRLLISVSGVGPSTAQVILSTYSTEEIIQSITSADVKAIESVKGIGAKTAQRIIIDLKDKVAKGMPTSDLLFDKIDNTIRTEALSALLALGFAKKAAESKIDKVMKSKSEVTSVEELVKTALSQM